MTHFVRRTSIPVSAAALYAWHARPGAFERLTPPWSSATLAFFDGIGEGQNAVIRVGPGVRWVAEHHALPDSADSIEGVLGFQDVQVDGPFAEWTHNHRFVPDGPRASILEDDITFRLPVAPVSTAIASPLARRQLDRMFAYRHRVTHEDLIRHRDAALPPMTIAVTGSSGLLGRALCAFLLTGGHRIVRLVRTHDAVRSLNRSAAERAVYWNVERSEVDEAALSEAAPDAVIHLAGESVYAVRWSADKKRRIWESRTKGTQLLSRALARMARPPEVLLSASASGIYGDRGNERLTEASPPGNGFLADVCQAWESSTHLAEKAGIRTVHLRMGLVLSPAGGLLDLILPIFRVGLGGRIAMGQRFLPWIALDDVLYAILRLLASATAGPVNLSAPTPVTGRRFAEVMETVLKRPARLAVPKPLVSLLGGELGRETVLVSQRMLPQSLLDAGFTFTYPTLDGALRHLLGAAPPPTPSLLL